MPQPLRLDDLELRRRLLKLLHRGITAVVHLPGVSPPVPTGSFSPLSPRFVDGYTERAARNAERRARAEKIVQARIRIDTLGEATTEVVHISTPRPTNHR